jgi:hypothetical protein
VASHAVGEGLRCQVLQRPARFSIYACDRYRQHLRSGGDAFTVSIRGASLVWPSLHDNEDGTYECEWQASVSGVYLVSVMLHGEHICGSPWAARAIAPGADPSQCRLRAGSSPVHAVAGLPACFDVRVSRSVEIAERASACARANRTPHRRAQVEFYDALGQGVAMEPSELRTVLKTAEAYAVRMHPKGAVKSAERMRLLLSAHESAEAYPERHCRASVTVEVAGDFLLHVLMQPNHQPLLGSPLKLHVSPAAPSAVQSLVEAKQSETRMRAGERRTVLVHTRDAWGNACKRGGANLAVSVSEAVECTVLDLGSGIYEVARARGTRAHAYTRARSVRTCTQMHANVHAQTGMMARAARTRPSVCTPAHGPGRVASYVVTVRAGGVELEVERHVRRRGAPRQRRSGHRLAAHSRRGAQRAVRAQDERQWRAHVCDRRRGATPTACSSLNQRSLTQYVRWCERARAEGGRACPRCRCLG